MSSSGLLLPPGVVQPFDLHRLHDDLHVMAFFAGHPAYEAVEAMIRRSGAGPPMIRAILTRHDQSQIDHVNDGHLLAAARLAQRQTCARDIALFEDSSGPCPRVHVEFVSHDGESVVLDVTSASPPDRARGGLSDPGRHSQGTSLPLMWRGKSAFAGAASRVIIDGVAWPIPVKFGDGNHFVARHGFFTESHDMLVLRAGTTALESGRGYRVIAAAAPGLVVMSHADRAGEVVTGRYVDGRFDLHRVDLDAAASGRRTSLVVDGSQRFRMVLDGASGSVDGDVRLDADGGIHLLPRAPAWAVTRAAHLRIAQSDGRLEATASIG
jgi:hypothetical protein